ncbi:MAG: hypothetical protein LBV14_13705 [Acidovorax sp.]|jgi:hypothetical protein|nr:hypothetical protein [Acidovorax sp.]
MGYALAGIATVPSAMPGSALCHTAILAAEKTSTVRRKNVSTCKFYKIITHSALMQHKTFRAIACQARAAMQQLVSISGL